MDSWAYVSSLLMISYNDLLVLQVEFKIKLPSMCARGNVPILIRQSDAELNNFKQVDVAPQGLV